MILKSIDVNTKDLFNEDGVPVRLLEWATKNITADEKDETLVYGLHAFGDHMYRIEVRLPAHAKTDYIRRGHKVVGTVEMPKNARYEVRTGEIKLISADGTEQARWLRYGPVDNPDWRLDWRLERHYYREYGDCPTILAHALNQIDKMLWTLTRTKGDSLTAYIALFGPELKDPHGYRMTPPEIQKLYYSFSRRFHERPVAKDSDLIDVTRIFAHADTRGRLQWYKELTRAHILSEGPIVDDTALTNPQLEQWIKTMNYTRNLTNMKYAVDYDLGMIIPIKECDTVEEALAWLDEQDPDHGYNTIYSRTTLDEIVAKLLQN